MTSINVLPKPLQQIRAFQQHSSLWPRDGSVSVVGDHEEMHFDLGQLGDQARNVMCVDKD